MLATKQAGHNTDHVTMPTGVWRYTYLHSGWGISLLTLYNSLTTQSASCHIMCTYYIVCVNVM